MPCQRRKVAFPTATDGHTFFSSCMKKNKNLKQHYSISWEICSSTDLVTVTDITWICSKSKRPLGEKDVVSVSFFSTFPLTEGEFERHPALLGFEKALIHEKVQMKGLGEGLQGRVLLLRNARAEHCIAVFILRFCSYNSISFLIKCTVSDCLSHDASFLLKLDCVNTSAGWWWMAAEDAAVELTIPTVVHFEQIPRLYYFTSTLFLFWGCD